MCRPFNLALTIPMIVLLQAPAFGQSQSGARGESETLQTTNQGAQNLPQRIQQKLQSQGFTDIHVVPEGFIVSAKDKDGDPVTMIIGPHSLALFTITQSNQSSSDSGEQGHYGSSASGKSDLGSGSGRSNMDSQGTGSGATMGTGRSGK